ncbi:MAG: hypothetical protein H0Z24_03585 [Thermosipho sp. (in: Bacteria)]|nr:hypothetical protein [Thermosipho sp. (in: thermotogales)]
MQPICHLTDRVKRPEVSIDEAYFRSEAPEKQKREMKVRMFRTTKVVSPYGVNDVCVISANSFRGITHRLGARDLFERLGLENQLSRKIYYILTAGGALEDSGKENPFKKEGFEKELRRLIPLVSLYGTSIGTGMIEGKLKPSFIWPVVKETAHLLGLDDENIDEMISANEIVSETMYTRQDDYPGEGSDDERKQQMIYKMQYMAAGVKLVSEISIIEPTEIELACFFNIMERFKERPYLGGLTSKGYGRVKIDEIPTGDPTPYIEFVENNKEEIKQFIMDLK